MDKQLFVIDGLDGSGKATQTKLLLKRLVKAGKSVRSITFPNYESDSSALIKMYLNGELSENPDDINAYAASSFYSVDRFASYIKDWRKDYESGKIILADRYTTSNLTHQMMKVDKKDWDEFILWLTNYEYNLLGLPKPTKVIYLDMLPEVSQSLMNKRYHGDQTKKDIHEKNINYIKACRPAGLYAADKLGFKVIRCFDGMKAKSILEIHNEIYDYIKEFI